MATNEVVSDSEWVTDSDYALIYHDDNGMTEDNRSREVGPRIKPSERNPDPALIRGRWSLRERKAIQRMPYSLEKIRHRQLLEGYDVSTFDAVAQQIGLQHYARRMNSGNTQDVNRADKLTVDSSNIEEREFIENGYSSDTDEGTEIPKLHKRNTKRLIYLGDDDVSGSSEYGQGDLEGSHDANFDADDTADDDSSGVNISYRGKAIDLKNGYKGIMPKSAWEKSIKQEQLKVKANKKYPKRKDAATKGVAKRKLTGHNERTSSELELLNDIVHSNEISNDDGSKFSHRIEDGHYLQILNNNVESEYFEDSPDSDILEDDPKYGDFFVHQNDLIVDLDTGVINIDDNLSSTSDSLDSSLIDQKPTEDFGSVIHPRTITKKNNKGRKAEGLIDYMLESGTRRRRQTPVYHKSFNNYKKNGMDYYGKRAKKQYRRKIGHLRKYIRKNRLNDGVLSNKHSVVDASLQNGMSTSNIPHLFQQHISYLPKTCDTNCSSDKGKDITYDIKTTRNFAPTSSSKTFFTTVIEAPGTRFGISKRNRTTGSGSVNGTVIEVEDNDKYAMPAFEALLKSKSYEPVDFCKINLGTRQFMLSRLQIKDTLSNLTELFNLIINSGATDIELLDCSHSLGSVLYYFNQSGVYHIIESFHRRFRAKVVSLIARAKPVHFYQIAVCQIYLLFVSRYNNTSSSLQKNLERKIIDHIISFFHLLELCFTQLTSHDLEPLFEAYNIMSSIITYANLKEEFWNRCLNESFIAQVALIVISIIPIHRPCWSLLRLRDHYDTLITGFQFVDYCIKVCNWHTSHEIIIEFNNIFKRLRFSDFKEEKERAKTSAKVLVSFDSSIPPTTLFNRYLILLKETSVSSSVVERIMPIGDILPGDDFTGFVNRVNLLIILSSKTKLNLERRFGQIISCILDSQYLSSCDLSKTIKIAESIAGGILAFLKVNDSRRLTFKANVLDQFYRSIIEKYSSSRIVWRKLLQRFNSIFPSLLKNRRSMLYALYKPLSTMINSNDFDKETSLVLKLYLEGLDELEPSWIQSHIFALIKTKSVDKIKYIDAYCKIGEFLIQKSMISWWTFCTYNSFESELEYYFLSIVIKSCDKSSYELLKKDLFDKARQIIFENPFNSYVLFCGELLKRENNIILEIFEDNTEDQIYVIFKWLFRAFERLKYTDFILESCTKLQRLFANNQFSDAFMMRVLDHMNARYLDYVKYSLEFITLKKSFHITGIENEISALKERFAMQLARDSGHALLINEIAKVVQSKNESSLEILVSLFLWTKDDVPFQVFAQIFSFIFTKPEWDALTIGDLVVGYYLLKVINKVLKEKCLLVSGSQFLSMCIILVTASGSHNLNAINDPGLSQNFINELSELQYQVLLIAQGFEEQQAVLTTIQCSLKNVPSVYTTPGYELTDNVRRNIKNALSSITQECHENDFHTDAIDESKIDDLTALVDSLK